MKTTKFKTTLLACCLAAISGYSTAGTTTGQLNVTLNLVQNCAILGNDDTAGVNNLGALDFGMQTDLDTALTADVSGATGALQISCPNGLPYYIEVNNGNNADATKRRMVNGTTGTDYITYELYRDVARTDEWLLNDSDAYMGSGTAQDVLIFGKVPTQTTPAVGVYTDTVMVTVNW